MLTHVITHPVKTGRPRTAVSYQPSADSFSLRKMTNIEGKKFSNKLTAVSYQLTGWAQVFLKTASFFGSAITPTLKTSAVH